MTKAEQIRQIIYRAADELAEVLAPEEKEQNQRPAMVNRKELAAFTGLSPTYCTQLIKKMEAENVPGVFRNGSRTVRVSLEEFERWYRNGKKLG